MYDDSECGETFSDFEGFVNSTFISREKIDYVTKHNLQLDCMWVIQVEEDWKVRLEKTLILEVKIFVILISFINFYFKSNDLYLKFVVSFLKEVSLLVF